jgi:hypothetical protein
MMALTRLILGSRPDRKAGNLEPELERIHCRAEATPKEAEPPVAEIDVIRAQQSIRVVRGPCFGAGVPMVIDSSLAPRSQGGKNSA